MIIIPILAMVAQSGGGAFATGPEPLLLQNPTVNETSIVFSYGGDLWSVARAGGNAKRLTSSPGREIRPFFSPDGKTIAFTAQYDGNADVFIIPADGGNPKRITYHPAQDVVAGWTPDGKSIIFASSMYSNTDAPRLFTVSANGGVPTQLPFPMGSMASMSGDMKQMAYVPGFKWELAWKRYRGGQAYSIWIAQMSNSKVVEIPRKGWNDEQPMWVGNKVFFLSDEKGPVGLSSYDVDSKKVDDVIPGNGFDIKSATAGPGAIVYEKLGSICLYDLNEKKSHVVPIEVKGDFPEIRPEFKDVSDMTNGISLSPSGQRAVVTARGWTWSVPASKGDARLLDEKQGVYRRDPAWSPDGNTISYITDENGHQQMALLDAKKNTKKFLDLGESPAYYYGSGASYWSPDSTRIAYYDNRNKLWVLNVVTGQNQLIDQTVYNDPNVQLLASWSPDSKWLTWSRDLDSHMQAVFVYNLESGKKSQITDGLSRAKNPIFDRNGKYIYFYASTNVGPALSWLDLSSYTNPSIIDSVYCVVLRKDLPNPLQPESDEEPGKADAPPQAGPPPATPPAATGNPAAEPSRKPSAPSFSIDLDGIESRIIWLPVQSGSYLQLEAGPPGMFFTVVAPPKINPLAPTTVGILSRFSMADRKSMPFGATTGVTTTPDGMKMLVSTPGGFAIVPTMAPTPPGTGAIDISGLRVKIDPKVEWKSIFDAIWSNEPVLFYDAKLHGINPEVMRKRYEPFLAGIVSRADLNYLFTDMLGEISVGHMWAAGGDEPGFFGVPGGLLGIDFDFKGGKYQITRVYDGERWNPGLYAPMAQPGVNAKAGDYILAIDGKELKDSNDIYEMLEGKAGKQVRVTISSSTSSVDAHEAVVVPVANDSALRNRAWAEDNRRYVEKMTNGRAGYVHVPDTNSGGWTSFIRYYYAQVGHDGIVVDERFNHGGLINDFMVDEMSRKMDAAFSPRNGKDWPTPGATIFGPKVMLINQFAGSGGDMFPWLFRHRKIGPLIGKRTWGGLIAAFSFPTVDGGQINSPDNAFYNVYEGKWDVEGHGVDPDFDVELDPFLWRQGKDAQLEKAIEQINLALKDYKPMELHRPASPDRSKVGIRY